MTWCLLWWLASLIRTMHGHTRCQISSLRQGVTKQHKTQTQTQTFIPIWELCNHYSYQALRITASNDSWDKRQNKLLSFPSLLLVFVQPIITSSTGISPSLGPQQCWCQGKGPAWSHCSRTTPALCPSRQLPTEAWSRYLATWST